MENTKELINVYTNNELVNTITDQKTIYKSLLNNLMARYLFKDKNIKIILKVDAYSFHGFHHIIIDFLNNRYYEYIIKR